MTFQLGEIYWVNFEPSIGREYKKVRPALVLQDEKISKKSPYVTVVPISGQIEKWRPPDVFIAKDHKNKLFENSIVKIQQISSFDKSRILGKIGEANSPTLRQVRGYLRRHFKL
ncbi:type II toxin-antitoxin system PemK/MazF family toxin [Candidatus Peregrinibacteria bacterium]|jgi:mRNA interferase MazF|nr:type II toxin-antitoxin system PemK/MazF family toxin [Candidatus Peregrinibacteria bacterium]MBT7702663.1 type II toxin-antitoxin system PemK/MazF family toxin [Candidatus Peregrinibacteria bacterium]